MVMAELGGAEPFGGAPREGRTTPDASLSSLLASSDPIVVVSPHDYDAIIGVSGVIQRLQNPRIVVVANGALGYTNLDERDQIVSIRRGEARRAYSILGVPKERIAFFHLPDFSVHNYRNWWTIHGRPGGYQLLAEYMRRERASGIVFLAANDDNPDHVATADIALSVAKFVCHPVAPDLGLAVPIEHVFMYRVWCALPFESSTLTLTREEAEKKRLALEELRSQAGLVHKFKGTNPELYATEQVCPVHTSPRP
jgi:LmbE family N-acetylglucosaminyl deacetylase